MVYAPVTDFGLVGGPWLNVYYGLWVALEEWQILMVVHPFDTFRVVVAAVTRNPHMDKSTATVFENLEVGLLAHTFYHLLGDVPTIMIVDVRRSFYPWANRI